MTISTRQFLEHCSASVAAFERLGPSVLDAKVKACGDWTALQLIEHMREVYERNAARIGASSNPQIAFDPAPRDEAISRMRHSFESLAARITELEPDGAAWNWTGRNLNVAWIARRIAHETAIHATDLKVTASPDALDSPESLFDPQFGADGVAEFIDIAFSRPTVRRNPKPDVATLHLHANDATECEWTIKFMPDQLVAERSHTKADAALKGPASSLYLWMWNRIGADNLESFGDASVIRRWSEEIAV